MDAGRHGFIPTTIERVETAIAKKPDLLVVTVTDAKAVRPTLERGPKAGVPVIAVNVANPAPKLERVPFLRDNIWDLV